VALVVLADTPAVWRVVSIRYTVARVMAAYVKQTTHVEFILILIKPTQGKRIYYKLNPYIIYQSSTVCMLWIAQLPSSHFTNTFCRAQWLRGRAADSRLRESGFESCAAVLKPFFNLQCSSSHSYISEYLAINSGGYVYTQPSRIKYSVWVNASLRSWDGVCLNRSTREVKCESAWAVLRTGYYTI